MHESYNCSDELLTATTSTGRVELLSEHDCSFMTVGTVNHFGLVCSGHFGNKTVKFNSEVRHLQVYWYICKVLVWGATHGHITLSGFNPDEAEAVTGQTN